MLTPVRKYHFFEYRTADSWQELIDYYRGFPSHWDQEPMDSLLSHIASTPIGTRIYGSISLSTLHLTIYEKIDASKETLAITYNGITEKWTFIYRSIPFEAKPFFREYPKELGIEKFDQIIKWLRW